MLLSAEKSPPMAQLPSKYQSLTTQMFFSHLQILFQNGLSVVSPEADDIPFLKM